MKNPVVSSRNLKFFIKIVLFATFLLGCNNDDVDKKSNQSTEKSEDIMTEVADRLEKVSDNEVKKAEKKVEESVNYDFLRGEWSGKFDGRKTLMVISDLEGNSFKGKITINYRDVINQEIKGSFDPEKNIIIMEDQLHSRYRGKYEGKLSEDKKSYSGKFTMKLDGKKFDFKLTKK